MLPRATRAILWKADNSVSIHNDVSNKPLNYMKEAAFSIQEGEDTPTWIFETNKESLHITIHSIISDTACNLAGTEDPGLIRDGTENQLQEWLFENPQVFGDGWTMIQREFPTPRGPVDLMALDEYGKPVAIEVKRVAMSPAIDQIRRYTEALRTHAREETVSTVYHGIGLLDLAETRGVVAALEFRPRALEIAERRGVTLVNVPFYWRQNQDNIPHSD